MLRSSLSWKLSLQALLGSLLVCTTTLAEPNRKTVKIEGAEANSSAMDKGVEAPQRKGLPAVIGVGPGFYFEETERTSERHENGDRTGEVQREDRVADGFVALDAWVLFPWLTERLRVGGGIAWFNSYALAFPEEEDNNDDDLYHVGHTFQLFGQGEFVLAKVASKLDVLFGLRGGGIVVFPGSEVQDELDFYEQQQFNVWQTPRLGVFVAPHVGGIWPLNNRLALRADVGIQFGKIWLYDAEVEARGNLIEIASALSTTRTQLLVGFEFSL